MALQNKYYCPSKNAALKHLKINLQFEKQTIKHYSVKQSETHCAKNSEIQ